MLDIHDDYWINLRYRCYQFRRPFLKPVALWNVCTYVSNETKPAHTTRYYDNV